MSRHDGDDEREFTVVIVHHSGLLYPDNGDRVGPDPHAGCGRWFVVSYETSRPQTKRPSFHTLQAGKDGRFSFGDFGPTRFDIALKFGIKFLTQRPNRGSEFCSPG